MKAGKVQPMLGLGEEEHQSFFRPASWMTKIQFTQQLIQNNNVIISILSEPNSGKTTFARILADSVAPEIKTALLTANPLFKPDVLLQQMTKALECTADNIADLITQANNNYGATLLIIDDAHFLTQAFIKDMLDALQTQSTTTFHVALVANFSLTISLNNLAQLYPDAIHSIELGPLSSKETESFLRDKLQAHPQVEALLTAERVQEFYELTEGSIVGINTQASAFFTTGSVDKAPKKKSQWILPTVAAGVGIIAFGVVYYMNNMAVGSLPPTEVVTELPTPAAIVEPTQPVQAKIEDEPILDSEIPAYTLAANYQAIQPTSLRKINLIDEAAEAAVPVDANYVVMDKVLVIPKVVSSKAAKDSVVAVNASKSTQTPTVAAKNSVANPGKSITVAANGYTIQLLASHKRNELLSFAKTHQIQGKAKIYQAKSGGVNWYVLTYGSYDQRTAAKQAVNTLPKSLAKLKPWVRDLAQLKSAG